MQGDPTLLKELYPPRVGLGELDRGSHWVTVRDRTPFKDPEIH